MSFRVGSPLLLPPKTVPESSLTGLTRLVAIEPDARDVESGPSVEPLDVLEMVIRSAGSVLSCTSFDDDFATTRGLETFGRGVEIVDSE